MPKKPAKKPLSIAKPKYYQKARQWRHSNGLKQLGFERAKMQAKGKFLEIHTGKRIIKTVNDPGLKPLYAFVSAESGNTIIIGRRKEKASNGTRISIEAYHGVPDKKGFLFKKIFASTGAVYHKKHNAVIESDFAWLNSDRMTGLKGHPDSTALTPGWLKGKGFGLFLDSIRLTEMARSGTKKWFMRVRQNPESKRFANLRGFRKPTKEEVEFITKKLGESPSPQTLKAWRVKDIMPVKRSQKKQ